MVGTDFFPTVDTGQMKLHFRAPVGTRIEETEQLVAKVERRIREIIPADELETINDKIGVPHLLQPGASSRPTTSARWTPRSCIALKPDHHPTAGYMKAHPHASWPKDFPGCTVYFQSADIVSQVLNFGLAAPIDVQIEGSDLDKDFEVARGLRDELARDSRDGRRAHRAGARLPDAPGRTSTASAPRSSAWPARRRQQPADLAVVERAGRRPRSS